MKPSDVKIMIESVGVPSAYYQFAENTGQQPPFICYFFGDSQDFYADNTNYLNIVPLYIELYTETKDFELEKAVESVLKTNELPFTKEDTYIDSERMHETVYKTSICLEV